MSQMKTGENEEELKGLMSIHLEGYEVIDKIVKKSGNSGRIYLPIEWVGSKVKIIRMTSTKK